MSIASVKARQRWNKANYAEIKASLKKDLVKQFKDKCKENEVSIASVLAAYMLEYCGEKPYPRKNKKTLLYDTRPKRRKMTGIIAGQLNDILQNEISYRECIPENLANGIRAESADHSIEKLSEALDMIREVY